MAVGFLTSYDGVELLLDGFSDRSDTAVAHADLVDRTDGRDFGGGAGEEDFVGNVERFARDLLFDNLDPQVASDLHDRVAGDAGQHGVTQRRGLQDAISHDEQILAGALAYVAVDVEGDAFRVAIDDRFHLDQLRVHVVGAGLGHGGQCVGSNAGPRGDTDVDALVGVGAEIFSPRVVTDVDLGGRVEGVDASFAVSAKDDGPNVAGPHAVLLDQV